MKTIVNEIKSPTSKWTTLETLTYPKEVLRETGFVPNSTKSYKITDGKSFIVVNSTDTFANVMPIENGIGAVALQKRINKTVKIQWFLVNEKGYMIHRCPKKPIRLEEDGNNLFVVSKPKGDGYYLVGENGILKETNTFVEISDHLDAIRFEDTANIGL